MKNYREMLKDYPSFLTADDIVKLGLFNSITTLWFARQRGDAPAHIRIGKKKILYPKESLIEYLEKAERNA